MSLRNVKTEGLLTSFWKEHAGQEQPKTEKNQSSSVNVTVSVRPKMLRLDL